MRQLSLAVATIALKPSFIKGFSPRHRTASQVSRYSTGSFSRLHLFGLGPKQNSKSNVDNTKDSRWPAFFEDILELARYKAEALEINSELADYGHYDVDNVKGKLVLTSKTKRFVASDTQHIGTFGLQTKTWMWAWANYASHIPEELLQVSLQVKEFGEKAGIDLLTEPIIYDFDEMEGWRLTAFAKELSDAEGIFRVNNGSNWSFMTFGQYTVEPLEDSQEEHTRDEN